MNINKTIFKEISTYLDIHDCDSNKMKEFLFPEKPNCNIVLRYLLKNDNERLFLQRQKNAIKIIEDIMRPHGKEGLPHALTELARVEYGIRSLQPRLRDHVVHALLTFNLGLYIKDFLFKQSNFYGNNFQWKLASLFHDIGYPVQVANDLIKPFAENINKIKADNGIKSPNINFKIVPEGIDSLTNNINSLDLIQKCLDKWELQIDAELEYKQMIKSGKICHGMLSALVVIYLIDHLYQKNNPSRKYEYMEIQKVNWNQGNFDREIIPACSAIFIHNLPSRCFEEEKIDQIKAPIAYLLKLSDSLQEWERPLLGNETGYSVSNFDFKVDANQLTLIANIPDERKIKIRKEISSTLVNPNVLIQ